MSRSKVFKAYGAWHAYSYAGKRYESFPTWLEAISHADREAHPQTITIKDPSGQLCDLTATINPRGQIRLSAGDDIFTLAPHEWKPLAHFLLDVDNRKEHE